MSKTKSSTKAYSFRLEQELDEDVEKERRISNESLSDYTRKSLQERIYRDRKKRAESAPIPTKNEISLIYNGAVYGLDDLSFKGLGAPAIHLESTSIGIEVNPGYRKPHRVCYFFQQKENELDYIQINGPTPFAESSDGENFSVLVPQGYGINGKVGIVVDCYYWKKEGEKKVREVVKASFFDKNKNEQRVDFTFYLRAKL